MLESPTSILQRGHVGDVSSQCRIHSMWNVCPHGSACKPQTCGMKALNSRRGSRQIIHGMSAHGEPPQPLSLPLSGFSNKHSLEDECSKSSKTAVRRGHCARSCEFPVGDEDSSQQTMSWGRLAPCRQLNLAVGLGPELVGVDGIEEGPSLLARLLFEFERRVAGALIMKFVCPGDPGWGDAAAAKAAARWAEARCCNAPGSEWRKLLGTAAGPTDELRACFRRSPEGHPSRDVRGVGNNCVGETLMLLQDDS